MQCNPIHTETCPKHRGTARYGSSSNGRTYNKVHPLLTHTQGTESKEKLLMLDEVLSTPQRSSKHDPAKNKTLSHTRTTQQRHFSINSKHFKISANMIIRRITNTTPILCSSSLPKTKPASCLLLADKQNIYHPVRATAGNRWKEGKKCPSLHGFEGSPLREKKRVREAKGSRPCDGIQ